MEAKHGTVLQWWYPPDALVVLFRFVPSWRGLEGLRGDGDGVDFVPSGAVNGLLPCDRQARQQTEDADGNRVPGHRFAPRAEAACADGKTGTSNRPKRNGLRFTVLLQ